MENMRKHLLLRKEALAVEAQALATEIDNTENQIMQLRVRSETIRRQGHMLNGQISEVDAMLEKLEPGLSAIPIIPGAEVVDLPTKPTTEGNDNG